MLFPERLITTGITHIAQALPERTEFPIRLQNTNTKTFDNIMLFFSPEALD